MDLYQHEIIAGRFSSFYFSHIYSVLFAGMIILNILVIVWVSELSCMSLCLLTPCPQMVLESDHWCAMSYPPLAMSAKSCFCFDPLFYFLHADSSPTNGVYMLCVWLLNCFLVLEICLRMTAQKQVFSFQGIRPGYHLCFDRRTGITAATYLIFL